MRTTGRIESQLLVLLGLLIAQPSLGVTNISIDIKNQTGANVNDVEIHSNKVITAIAPATVPPFTVTSGLNTQKVTLSGGTLANGNGLTATLTLATDGANITRYSWTINGAVQGSSIVASVGVPAGLMNVDDAHITLSGVGAKKITAVRVIEPAGWMGTISGDGKRIDLSGGVAAPGTNFKIEIYVGGLDKKFTVKNWTWTSNGAEIGNSKPVLVFNDTGGSLTSIVAVATAPVTAISPNPPPPFTTVTGIGTSTVTLSGGTLPDGEGVGVDGLLQFDSVPGSGVFDVSIPVIGIEPVPMMGPRAYGLLSAAILSAALGLRIRNRRRGTA